MRDKSLLIAIALLGFAFLLGMRDAGSTVGGQDWTPSNEVKPSRRTWKTPRKTASTSAAASKWISC